jgi:hypothetical protein
MKPGLGASIGPQVPGSGPGTAGGVLHLKAGGKTYEGVITNHRVIQPTINASEQEKMNAAKGYDFDQLSLYRPLCQAPHEADLRKLQAAISTKISRCQEDVAQTRKRYDEKKTMYGDTRPIDTQLLEATKRNLEQTLGLQAIELGEVIVSSGQLLSTNFTRLDWAFVGKEKAQSSLIQPGDRPNKLPTDRSFLLSGQAPHHYNESAGSVYGNSPSFSPFEFSRMVKDQWFSKVGRTTDITAGICSGVQVDVTIMEGDIYYNENGGKIDRLGNRTIRHWVVMNGYRDTNTKETHDSPFCADGDYGSFVIDRWGEVAGLLHGHLSNFSYGHGGMGLVSCMSEVVPSIERRTTMKNEDGEEIKGQLTLPTIWS